MFRDDVLWLLPALVISIFQAKYIWGNLPAYKEHETEISGDHNLFDQIKLSYLTTISLSVFWLQLVFVILPITDNNALLLGIRAFGYLMILLGFMISLSALNTLGKNWTAMDEYRIKKDQVLITYGVYSLIRHPIYLSVILEIVGFQLVSNSLLVIPFLILNTLVFDNHIRKEDTLLKQKFGEDFVKYKKQTKAFIPFVF